MKLIQHLEIRSVEAVQTVFDYLPGTEVNRRHQSTPAADLEVHAGVLGPLLPGNAHSHHHHQHHSSDGLRDL